MGDARTLNRAGRATGHMVAKVGMLEEGDNQLEMWEACGEQVVHLSPVPLLTLNAACEPQSTNPEQWP